MTVSIDKLQTLEGHVLPGGRITIEPHESFIGEEALRAEPGAHGGVHPAWFVIASLRCMGISVDELCALAFQEEGDVLLFGNCRVEQHQPLREGVTYLASAHIGEVSSRTTRDGARLDSVEVIVRLRVQEPSGRDVGASAEVEARAGEIVSTYLFKRGSTT
ncbi:hypothetical protein [Nocardioides sp.]|uniref:hypothetical protein n=1 Tax=Nocardioides sp. TaxID=35761 RepID=UPI00261422BD|nr:hypothetical protein [Nocardioides sp.]MDI6909232.1 hypothetical protein [Nocardioides sp.]